MNKLDGYKTYVIVLVAVIYAVFTMFINPDDRTDAIEFLFAALAAGGIRSGMKTERKHKTEALQNSTARLARLIEPND